MSEAVILAIIGGLLGGSAVAALINAVAEGIRQRRKRKYDKADGKDKNIEALKAGLKWVLYDRIRHLGQRYIAAGFVDFDDRRILNEMHGSYHDGLGGNGDLDNLMGQVNRLPLGPAGPKGD